MQHEMRFGGGCQNQQFHSDPCAGVPAPPLAYAQVEAQINTQAKQMAKQFVNTQKRKQCPESSLDNNEQPTRQVTEE